MRTQPPYQPRTVLACGIARLGDALPANPFKPTTHHKTMPNTAKPAKPAKPAKARALPKDKDYSRPYVSAAAAGLSELDDIVIDNHVPAPGAAKITRQALMQALLARLQPGQSAKLRFDLRSSLAKVMSAAHKAGLGRYVARIKHDDDKTVRVWRTK